MKPRIPAITLLLAALAIATFAIPGASELLQFDRSAIETGQTWRALSGHLTHWSLDHLAWDVCVFALLGASCERVDRRRFLLCTIGSMFLISAGVWLLIPDMTLYRGLSGVDSALFAMLAAHLVIQAIEKSNHALLAITLLTGVGFLIKLSIELSTGQTVFVDSTAAGIVPVPLAHAIGAGWGAVTGLAREAVSARSLSAAPSKWAVAVIAVVLPVTSSGCTAVLWHGALHAEWNSDELRGIIIEEQERPVAAIISYDRPRMTASEIRYVVIPLSPDGWAIAPFPVASLEGRGRLGRGEDVPMEQVHAVASLRPRLVRQVDLVEGQTAHEVRSEAAVLIVGDDEVRVFAYDLPPPDAQPIEPPGQPDGWPWTPSAEARIDSDHLPSDRVLIVPRAVPRSAGDRTASIVGAVMLTPVTLAGNVLLIPMMFLGMADPP